MELIEDKYLNRSYLNVEAVLAFDGVDDYVDTKNDSIISLNDDFTIETICYVNDLTVQSRLISQYDDSAGQFWGVILYVHSDRKIKFLLGRPSSSGGGFVLIETDELKEKTLYHVTVVKSATKIDLLINGQLVSSANLEEPYDVPNPGYSLKIGITEPVLDDAAPALLNGGICLVRFHNKALSQSEVNELFNQPCSPPPTLHSSIVGEWIAQRSYFKDTADLYEKGVDSILWFDSSGQYDYATNYHVRWNGAEGKNEQVLLNGDTDKFVLTEYNDFVEIELTQELDQSENNVGIKFPLDETSEGAYYRIHLEADNQNTGNAYLNINQVAGYPSQNPLTPGEVVGFTGFLVQTRTVEVYFRDFDGAKVGDKVRIYQVSVSDFQPRDNLSHGVMTGFSDEEVAGKQAINEFYSVEDTNAPLALKFGSSKECLLPITFRDAVNGSTDLTLIIDLKLDENIAGAEIVDIGRGNYNGIGFALHSMGSPDPGEYPSFNITNLDDENRYGKIWSDEIKLTYGVFQKLVMNYRESERGRIALDGFLSLTNRDADDNNSTVTLRSAMSTAITDIVIGRASESTSAYLESTFVRRIQFIKDADYEDADLLSLSNGGWYHDIEKGSLIADWSFQDDAELLADRSENKFNGTKTGFKETDLIEVESGLPPITKAMRFDGVGNYLKVPDFNPSGEEGYTRVIFLKSNYTLNDDPELIEIVRNDDNTDNYDATRIATDSGVVALGTRLLGSFASGQTYIDIGGLENQFQMISRFQTVKVGNSKLLIYLNGNNYFEDTGEILSDVAEGDYSLFDNPSLAIGSNHDGEACFDGYVSGYGLVKGNLSDTQLKKIWNNGNPRYIKEGIDWEILVDFSSIIDPTGTPKLRDLSSRNRDIFLEGFSGIQLDDTHGDYALVDLNELRGGQKPWLREFINAEAVLAFDGVDDYVSLGNLPLLNDSSFSIEWIASRSENGSNSQRLFGNRASGVSVGIVAIDKEAGTGNLAIYLSDGTNNLEVNSYDGLSEKQLYHGLITFDYTGKEAKLYINGILKDTAVDATLGSLSISTEFCVGRDGERTNDPYYEGTVGLFRLHSKVLSLEEVIGLSREPFVVSSDLHATVVGEWIGQRQYPLTTLKRLDANISAPEWRVEYTGIVLSEDFKIEFDYKVKALSSSGFSIGLSEEILDESLVEDKNHESWEYMCSVGNGFIFQIGKNGVFISNVNYNNEEDLNVILERTGASYVIRVNGIIVYEDSSAFTDNLHLALLNTGIFIDSDVQILRNFKVNDAFVMMNDFTWFEKKHSWFDSVEQYNYAKPDTVFDTSTNILESPANFTGIAFISNETTGNGDFEFGYAQSDEGSDQVFIGGLFTGTLIDQDSFTVRVSSDSQADDIGIVSPLYIGEAPVVFDDFTDKIVHYIIRRVSGTITIELIDKNRSVRFSETGATSDTADYSIGFLDTQTGYNRIYNPNLNGNILTKQSGNSNIINTTSIQITASHAELNGFRDAEVVTEPEPTAVKDFYDAPTFNILNWTEDGGATEIESGLPPIKKSFSFNTQGLDGSLSSFGDIIGASECSILMTWAFKGNVTGSSFALTGIYSGGVTEMGVLLVSTNRFRLYTGGELKDTYDTSTFPQRPVQVYLDRFIDNGIMELDQENIAHPTITGITDLSGYDLLIGQGPAVGACLARVAVWSRTLNESERNYMQGNTYPNNPHGSMMDGLEAYFLFDNNTVFDDSGIIKLIDYSGNDRHMPLSGISIAGFQADLVDLDTLR